MLRRSHARAFVHTIVSQHAVLLASWTKQHLGDGLESSGTAMDQLNYLYDVMPHTTDGAISHIVKEFELWVSLASAVFFRVG